MSQVHRVILDHLAVLELRGGQPDQLLQGQVTCDLRLLKEDQALPGLLCNLKGRVVTSFELLRLASDHLLLVLPADNLQALTDHLKKFLPFFRCTLQEVTDQWQLLGLSGKEVPALISSQITPWSEGKHAASVSEMGIALRLPAILPRALVLLKKNHSNYATLLQRLESLTETTLASCWQMLDIQAGRVEVSARLTDSYLPQMLNFQAVGAISFKKGCYIGQEIVARAQYRGQVKKRLYRAHLPCIGLNALPVSVQNSDNKVVGEIVLSAPDRHGATEALAVLSIKAVEEATPLFVQIDGQSVKLNLLQLPYDAEGRLNAPFETA